MTEEDKSIAVIDDPTYVVEGGEGCDEETADGSVNEVKALGLLVESVGWIFPKIKLSSWDPENEKQWEVVGKRIAHRNLIVSIPNLTCSFGVWLVWSVIATEIQEMHDKDSQAFAFEDWGSPKGTDVSSDLFCAHRSKV
jgi:hypothetical protein